MEVPAQPHREVAGQRLLLERRLHRDEREAGASNAPASSIRVWPRPPTGARLTAPSQSTMRPSIANSSASNTPMRAVNRVIAICTGAARGTCPQEREEAARGRGLRIRVRMHEPFEELEKAGSPAASSGRERLSEAENQRVQPQNCTNLVH